MQWPRALYDHEEMPPPHCWDEVKQTISKEPISLGHSLNQWEAVPPAESWNLIAAEIQETKSLPRIPAAKTLTRRPLVAYAAAIAVMLLLASVLWYSLNDRENGLNVRDLAAGLTYSDSPAQAVPGPEISTNEQSAPGMETPAEAAPPTTPLAKSGELRETHHNSTAPHAAPAEIQAPKVPDVAVSYADGNYIQLTEPDGDVTRVSYKLDRMVKAMHAGGNNRSQRQEWNRKLETWTSRMAQSTYVPSGGNFFDIAEFVEFLNDAR